jgi:hypothetical protein
MVQTDDRILEFLSQFGPSTPAELHAGLDDLGRDVGASPAEIVSRCRLLDSFRLVDYEGEHTFSLSSTGAGYLAGEVDCSRLEQWYSYEPEDDLVKRLPAPEGQD